MDKKQRKELASKLTETKLKVEKHIQDLKELTKPIAPENAIGRVSRMDAINNKSVNEAALRTAENKLKSINRAMEIIDDPNFGKCVRCGNDIPPGRLMIMPESTRCVRCAQL